MVSPRSAYDIVTDAFGIGWTGPRRGVCTESRRHMQTGAAPAFSLGSRPPFRGAHSQGKVVDQATIERMVRARKTAAEELLMQAPIDGLDEALTMLRRYCPAEEVRAALTERIAKAPVEDLEMLGKHLLQALRVG